ncbi:MAG TPA: substrate-binding domain-containing protein, partial [Acidimicrobiales bacterium]|nr:substrate-binding domain-containing protein [Acidimicrobiales bacterium]
MSISRRSRRPARCIVVVAAVGLALTALPVAASAATAGRISASKTTNVIVQGGTTPTDSGLLQNVIEPGFKKMYPQYNLQYVSVGTGQAITNAENGEADAVFTHSATLENSFVASGYSYEPGGRLVMSSDFVTVGANSDPAGVLTGPSHDVVAAFT